MIDPHNYIDLELEFEKSTKNTYKFYDEDECMGSVYINKEDLKDLGYRVGDTIKIRIVVN